MPYHINSVEEMSVAALASGTHRVNIREEAGKFYAELVEREDPDPEIVYRSKAKDSGYAFVCETPVPDYRGRPIEIVGVPDAGSPFRFRLVVSFTNEAGELVQYPLEPKY